MNFLDSLTDQKAILVRQRHELAEFIGYETRNKYEILDETEASIGFAAEQQKGFWSFFARQFLGHWRTFNVFIFDRDRNILLKCHHPFRFYFNRFEIRNSEGQILGTLERRFSLLHRRFDVLGPGGGLLCEMHSPLFRIWTFKFILRGNEIARIEKKWSGLFSEAMSDRDNFKLNFISPNTDSNLRSLFLAACVFVDLLYFEKKANN